MRVTSFFPLFIMLGGIKNDAALNLRATHLIFTGAVKMNYNHAWLRCSTIRENCRLGQSGMLAGLEVFSSSTFRHLGSFQGKISLVQAWGNYSSS
jgi:hypothetical protein